MSEDGAGRGRGSFKLGGGYQQLKLAGESSPGQGIAPHRPARPAAEEETSKATKEEAPAGPRQAGRGGRSPSHSAATAWDLPSAPPHTRPDPSRARPRVRPAGSDLAGTPGGGTLLLIDNAALPLGGGGLPPSANGCFPSSRVGKAARSRVSGC